jgi:hypothetical protein
VTFRVCSLRRFVKGSGVDLLERDAGSLRRCQNILILGRRGDHIAVARPDLDPDLLPRDFYVSPVPIGDGALN